MPSADEMFRSLISLVGRQVEVGLRASGERLSGKVAYAMFDSFLMDVASGRRVIPFSDILYLDPLD